MLICLSREYILLEVPLEQPFESSFPIPHLDFAGVVAMPSPIAISELLYSVKVYHSLSAIAAHGPALVGLFLACILYGIMLLQCFGFFTHFSK